MFAFILEIVIHYYYTYLAFYYWDLIKYFNLGTLKKARNLELVVGTRELFEGFRHRDFELLPGSNHYLSAPRGARDVKMTKRAQGSIPWYVFALIFSQD